jgi:tetratricopeptide (TPR) repeat protein
MKRACDRGSLFRVSRPRCALLVLLVSSLAAHVVACGGGGAAARPTDPEGAGGGGGTGGTGGGGGGPADPVVFEPSPDDVRGADAGSGDAPEEKPPETKPEPEPEPADQELVHTVKTKRSRADMSADLVKPAQKAADKREFARAIVLYRALVVARGPGSPEGLKLAEMWALAGRPEQARAAFDAFIAATKDAKAKEQAVKTRAALPAEDPFARQFVLPALTKEAKKVFDLGRKAEKKKSYGDALVYYQMGSALDPDLPGFLRQLGAVYEKLGGKDKAIDFYKTYLQQRPFGKNADEVRKELKKHKVKLGKLSIKTSKECEEVYLGGQIVPKKLPVKDLTVAPGRYRLLCFNGKYGLFYRDFVTVKEGDAATMEFRWATIVNELENPYGRISLESSWDKGVMMDLGIDIKELGVPVPDDNRALRMVLTDDAGTKSVERFQKLEPGQRYVIKW